MRADEEKEEENEEDREKDKEEDEEAEKLAFGKRTMNPNFLELHSGQRHRPRHYN